MNNEPVAWMHKNPDYPISKHWSQEYNIPLYTHPVKELTDEEIEQIFFKLVDRDPWEHRDEKFYIDFAKAILRKASEK